MNTLAIVASVVVGAAFVVAGGSKIAAGASWPTQARGLGAPAWTIALVPPLELVIGALLIVQIARRPAAVAAIGLLAVFTALIAMRLHEGVHPPCACFGAWSAKPIGPGHIARNTALIALAAIPAIVAG